MAIMQKLMGFLRAQKGFSLMQLLIAMAITAMVGTVITVSLWQTISVDGASNNHMLAISQVENAVYRLNKDLQMSLPPESYESGFPLVLISGGTAITYSIITPHDGTPAYLQRNAGSVTQAVATHVNTDPGLTSCFYAGGKLTITITVTTGGFRSATESRTLVVSPRLNQ